MSLGMNGKRMCLNWVWFLDSANTEGRVGANVVGSIKKIPCYLNVSKILSISRKKVWTFIGFISRWNGNLLIVLTLNYTGYKEIELKTPMISKIGRQWYKTIWLKLGDVSVQIIDTESVPSMIEIQT